MDLLRNGDFSQPGGADEPVLGWTLWSPRPALRPRAERLPAGVRLAGNGSRGVWGALRQRVTAVRPGHAYRLEVWLTAEGPVACLHDALDVIVIWEDAAGQNLQTDFGWRLQAQEGAWRLDMPLLAPAQAAVAVVHLVFHWSPAGAILWQRARLTEAPRPRPRLITVSALSIAPPADALKADIWNHLVDLLETAGRRGSDLAVSTEYILGFRTDDLDQQAEPIPGPTTDRLAAVARKHRMYVTASILEREGDLLFNTAFLLGREGQVVGKYRKVHLTQGEIFAGLTPGWECPVFECDFGKVGLTICYDNKFPDIHRTLALRGAEILISCQEGDGRQGGFTHDIVAQARAINNGCWVIGAGRASPNTGQANHWFSRGTFIISPEGYVLSNSGKMGPEVQTRTIDLGRSLKGALTLGGCETWNDVWRAARRPALYGPLTASTTPG